VTPDRRVDKEQEKGEKGKQEEHEKKEAQANEEKDKKSEKEEKTTTIQESTSVEETSDERDESNREKAEEDGKQGGKENKKEEETKKVEERVEKESGLLPLPTPLPRPPALPPSLVRTHHPIVYPSFYAPNPAYSLNPSLVRFTALPQITPFPNKESLLPTAESHFSANPPQIHPHLLNPYVFSPPLRPSPSPTVPYAHPSSLHHPPPSPVYTISQPQPRKATTVSKNPPVIAPPYPLPQPSLPPLSPTALYSPHTPPSPMSLDSPNQAVATSPPPESLPCPRQYIFPSQRALLPDPFPRESLPLHQPPSVYYINPGAHHPPYALTPSSALIHPYGSLSHPYHVSYPSTAPSEASYSCAPAQYTTPTSSAPLAAPPLEEPQSPPSLFSFSQSTFSQFSSLLTSTSPTQLTSEEPFSPPSHSPPASPTHHTTTFRPPAPSPSSPPTSPETSEKEPPSALEQRIRRILHEQEERHKAAYHHLEQKMNQIRQLAASSHSGAAQQFDESTPAAPAGMSHGNFAAIEALATYNKTGSLSSSNVVASSSYRANSALYSYLKISAFY